MAKDKGAVVLAALASFRTVALDRRQRVAEAKDAARLAALRAKAVVQGSRFSF